jgi:hypothetical protein
VKNFVHALIVSTLALLLCAHAAHAAVDIVTTNADDGSAGTLRQIIQNSNPGDTVNFATNLSGSIIVLTNGQILLTNNLTIDASALPGGIQINGNAGSRIFEVASNNVVLNSLTITNGTDTNDPTYGGYGGGIYNSSGTLTLTNCILSGNTSGEGGGIYNGGNLTLTNCILSGNTCGSGGGILNGGNLTLTSCTLSNNSATGFDGGGGGICNESSGTLILTNCILSGNTALQYGSGGGIYNNRFANDYVSIIGNVSLTSCILSGNTASEAGGGILNNGNLTLTSCTLFSNSATNFGGGYSDTAEGGGICNDSGNLTLTSCTLSNNSAVKGGGLYNYNYYNDTVASLTNCTLSANLATNYGGGSFSYGGGIYNTYGNLTLTSCTLFSNLAVIAKPGLNVGGGGIYNFENYFGYGTNGSLTVNQSTLSGNSAINGNLDTDGSYGGGIESAGNATLFNSIVAGNSADFGPNILGGFTNSGANLTNGTPLLAPLGNYGGSTQTMPPLPGSPAIDAGGDSATNTIATDQRGYPRLSGTHVDIGAVELQQATVTTLAASNFTLSNATLNAAITPGDLTNAWYFEFGTNTSYGSYTIANTLASATNAVNVSNILTGLTPGTTYHYQILANDGVSIKTGGDTNFITLIVGTAPSLNGVQIMGNGALQFGFTNVTGASFTVYASTNIALPLAQWTNLGMAVEAPAGSGQYQFTDPQATNNAQQFYRVSSP